MSSLKEKIFLEIDKLVEEYDTEVRFDLDFGMEAVWFAEELKERIIPMFEANEGSTRWIKQN